MSTTITPRRWEYIVLQGDDEATLRTLRNQADALDPGPAPAPAQPSRTALLGEDDTEATEYADRKRRHDEAVEIADAFAIEAEQRGVTVVLQALGSRKRWADLKARHPGRSGDDADKAAGGVNTSTMPEDLVSACLVEPALADADREAFLDSLTEAQFELLALAAWQLHTELGADPKARLRS